ncbi:prepilin-type N-terminal cleavage/methylation domain-containing protein [Thermovibrio guaymasensis]|nr:prepilin-type N-terminal cleavage/methylation domain-containing protein [Thermovibrio guaymasensis]
MRLGRRGFTLVELLIAVALSAFILVVSYNFFNVVESSGKFAVENSKLQSSIPPYFYSLLKDFESVNQRYGGFTVSRDVDGNLKSVEFFTEDCYYFKGICKVKYWLYESPSGKKFLIRSELRINSNSPKGIEVPVSFNINSFEVYKLSGGSWVKMNTGRADLIKLVLGFKGGGELPLVFKVRT